MQMLERYLNAIAFWLPNGQRQDIIAEISEDLKSQIEDEQSALGRNLNPGELEDLLRRRGRPVLVANRYRQQQSLIGPVWFPAYVLTLKFAAIFSVAPWLIAFTVIHRAQHPGLNWGGTLLAAWTKMWTIGFVNAGLVTLVFALLQFAETKMHFLEKWNPRSLPPINDPHNIPVINSLTELVAHGTFLLWWTAVASSPVLFDGSTFKLSLAPVCVYFFWCYLALGSLNIAAALRNLQTRHWTGLRAAYRLLLDLAGGVLFCWLMKADVIGTIYIASMEPGRTLEIKNAIQLWLDRCFPIAVIVSLIVVMVDIMRILRLQKKNGFVLSTGQPLTFN